MGRILVLDCMLLLGRSPACKYEGDCIDGVGSDRHEGFGTVSSCGRCERHVAIGRSSMNW